MQNKIPDPYKQRVKQRGRIKYIIGLLSRTRLYIRYALARNYAKLKGATIGKGSIIPWELARVANKNLVVGDDVIIETAKIDLRGGVFVKDHCIIGKNVEIIRVSHFLDSKFTTRYYTALVIEPYSWLATGCKILPSCTNIAEGSVIGAYSVVVKDTKAKQVYSGFPAKILREREELFTDLVIVSLKGGDLLTYYRSRHE